jgi:hypothetical protein
MENSYFDIFTYLYDKAPIELRKIVDNTRLIEQDPIWHPENFVYKHIKLVTNRLHNSYNDINLNLCGFFHDLGKAETTKWDISKQSWTAPGHEDVSSKIVIEFKDWIIQMGGDVDIVLYVVQNHMRFKYLNEIRLPNKIKFIDHPHFDYLLKFNSADFGGCSLNIQELMDTTNIKKQIDDYKKTIEENKIITSRFNGNMIMVKYPNLKDKELGDTINKFKKYISDTYMVFRKYVLSNVDIMQEFDKFMKS